MKSGAPSESKLNQLKSLESKWHQVKPSDTKWNHVSKSVQLGPSDSTRKTKRNQVKPSEMERNQVKWNETKWSQAEPNWIEWNQLSVNEAKWCAKRCAKWGKVIQIRTSRTKWGPLRTIVSRWDQVFPSECKWVRMGSKWNQVSKYDCLPPLNPPIQFQLVGLNGQVYEDNMLALLPRLWTPEATRGRSMTHKLCGWWQHCAFARPGANQGMTWQSLDTLWILVLPGVGPPPRHPNKPACRPP